MIRLVIIGQDGKTVSPEDLATAVELHAAAEQAKALIRDCERVARLKAPQGPAGKHGGIPYLT
jgi:hypothetical protein